MNASQATKNGGASNQFNVQYVHVEILNVKQPAIILMTSEQLRLTLLDLNPF